MTKDRIEYTGLEIAVIGMACRFPGAADWRQFWDAISSGAESIKTLSDQELVELKVDEELIKNPNFIRIQNTLEGKDKFDSSFFGYRPEEARAMNPVHRVFHECIWEALEDAGYTPHETVGQVGLFAGANEDPDWRRYVQSLHHGLDLLTLNYLNSKDYLTTLPSYKLNLKGPALTISTACSTSLVAINLACKSLLLGESTIALAGGVSILSKETIGYLHTEGMIGSADGHCRAFDKNASGTVRGEGAGIVVLKRLRNAIADKDNIFAIIKGSAINNDGNRKVGFTAPSIEGQVECIKSALQFARVEPHTIQYVEAHGTGTKLGDPIEVEALNIAFNRNTDHKCAIGSVKTNIGHLDTAAGIAGFIKAVLCLKFKQLPPSLHFVEPNSEIDFKGGPFYVNTNLKQWPEGPVPARAAVSSFGIGGTNAHVILEQAPDVETSDDGREHKMLVVSAKSKNSLIKYADHFRNFIFTEESINLNDLCYTFQIGRKHFQFRKTFLFTNQSELISSLESDWAESIVESKPMLNVVFMFPGQGSQYIGMGKNLYKLEPVFREEMEKGFILLEELTNENFRTFLFSTHDQKTPIDQTRFVQPLLFLIEFALAKTLIALGVNPKYMIGHSVGEYVAACIAHVFSFEDAMRLVCERGALMSELPLGDMISVAISRAEAEQFVGDLVSLAAVNNSEQTVLSGHPSAIGQVIETLLEREIAFVKLKTSHAFHSSMLDSVLDKYAEILSTIKFNKPILPFISNLTGKFITNDEACSPEYWVRHMRETVRFFDGINTLVDEQPEIFFLEVGPGSTLSKLVQRRDKKVRPLMTFQTLGKVNHGDDVSCFYNLLAQIWEHGQDLNWKTYYNSENRRRLSLPTYSFEPISYPIDFSTLKVNHAQEFNSQVNERLENWVYIPSWSRMNSSVCQKTAKKRGFVFFSNGNDFAKQVKNRIVENEGTYVEVTISDNFKRLSKNSFTLDPRSSDGFKLLFNQLQIEQREVTDIIYSWNMSVLSSDIDLSEDGIDIIRTYFALAKIAQALIQIGSISDKRVTILCDKVYNVLGYEKMSVAQSITLGLANVIRQEHLLRVQTIDVDLSDFNADIAKNVVAEICSDTPSALTVAYRRGVRWTPSLQKFSLLPKSDFTIKSNAVILITGGLGDVGFAFAKHLIQKYKSKLILVGRRDIMGSGNSLNRKAKSRFLDLTNRSDYVKYYMADVGNLKELQKVTAEVEKEYGRIDGVIHAAGLIDKRYFELVEDITTDKTLTMFAPKVKGICNLYNIFGPLRPDFVWVTSSISTILGGLSYASYSASNLFMDHFVTSISSKFPEWKCVDLAELGVGDPVSGWKYPSLKPSEMFELFDWSVGLNHTPVIFEAKGDLELRIKEAYAGGINVNENEIRNLDHHITRPHISSDYLRPETETETEIAALFEDFFGIKPIGVSDDFFELGGDSLKAMMILKRIKSRFNLDLPLTDFLKYPTVKLISAKIDEMIWFKTETDMKNETKI